MRFFFDASQSIPGINKISLKALVIFILVLFFPYTSSADDQMAAKPVVVTGEALITGANTALARDAAMADALRKAIEQAVGTIVSSETVVDNYQVLNDNIYTRSQGYVHNYVILKESQVQNLYQVTIRADVAVGRLKDDISAIGLLQKRAEKPRVVFMIAERSIGHKYYVFWWWGKSEFKGETVDMSVAEVSLKEFFIRKGFNVVDASGSADKIEIKNSYRVADLTAEGAKEIGKDLNAEVVVVGKAMAEEGPGAPGSRIGLYLADITAQAVRVDDGVVLGSATGHGAARHISAITGGSEALKKAADEAAESLTDQIMARWSSGNTVTVKLSGNIDYTKFSEFKSMLKTRVRGIGSVYQRKFDSAGAVLELDSKVPAQNIADDISRLGLPIKVTGTTANTIEIRMDGTE